MAFRPEQLDPPVARVESMLTELVTSLPAHRRPAVDRWLGDGAALRFHVGPEGEAGRRGKRPPLVAIIGGTGTGKSTIVNRLTGSNFTASSFRRTFTSGAVAIVAKAGGLPEQWLGYEHVIATAAELPVRGRDRALIVVTAEADAKHPTLVDTPDLDGDTPLHHAQADRVFRWAEAVVFVVTPEKYQMTELPPYYALAARYGLPAIFVMNKCEESAVEADYASQLTTGGYLAEPGHGNGTLSDRVYVVPRDGSGYAATPEQAIESLREAVQALRPSPATGGGLQARAADVLSRLQDQVIAPLRADRQEADRLIAALRGMETPPVGVNVNPLTQQLQRRLQQKSILYLMGPGRIIERVRQAPMILARLPRFAWDFMRKGEVTTNPLEMPGGTAEAQALDFKTTLADQFALLQSRIDDVIRGSPSAAKWLEPAGQPDAAYAAARFETADAGKIADEELAALKAWLEKRWNAAPRDTRMLETLLKFLPGGKRLAKWTEAAPYLLTIILVTHGAVFGHLDLIILGGYSLATWVGEKLSNEVTSRARATNVTIESRFVELAHEQIDRICNWLDRHAVSPRILAELEKEADRIGQLLE